MIDRGLLKETAASLGVTVDDAAAETFDVYARLLVEWNEKMNLTAITDPTGIAVKHFADSLAALPLMPAEPFSLIDVGTGAGFPSVPLAILRPDIRLTLLDSLNKRLMFLEELCRALGVDAARVHARAEEGGQSDLREQFDVATARAVAGLPALVEMCLPFVKVGGKFVALKGRDGESEVQQAARAVEILGGSVGDIRTVHLPDEGGEALRQLITVNKIKQTPKKYPRPNIKKATPL